MKKIVRITESEINNIVKRVLKEEDFITRVGSPLDSIENYVKENYGVEESKYLKGRNKFIMEPGNGWGMDIRLQDGGIIVNTYELVEDEDFDYNRSSNYIHKPHEKKIYKTVSEVKGAIDEFFNEGLRKDYR